MHVKRHCPIQSLYPVPGQGCIPCLKFGSKMQGLACKPVPQFSGLRYCSRWWPSDLFSPIEFVVFGIYMVHHPMAVQWRSGANSPGIWSCIFGPEKYLKVCIPGCECQAGQRVCFSFCVFARHLQKWRLLRFCKFIGFLASVTLLNSIHAKGPDVCPVLWLDVNEWTGIMT